MSVHVFFVLTWQGGRVVFVLPAVLWQGLKIMLSAKFAQGQIKVVDHFNLQSHKTKHCVQHLRRLLGEGVSRRHSSHARPVGSRSSIAPSLACAREDSAGL